MAGEEFLLKWNDHHNSFFSIMQDLYSSESMTDVTLACGGQVFETHKIILCVCSTFFRNILNRRRDKAPIVFLKDIHPKHLEQLLQYMYNGEINVLQEDLAPLIEAARSLQIKGLADAPSQDNNKQSQQARPPRPSVSGGPPPMKRSKPVNANKRKAESPSQIIASNHAQQNQLNYAREDLVAAQQLQQQQPGLPRGGPALKEQLEAYHAQLAGQPEISIGEEEYEGDYPEAEAELKEDHIQYLQPQHNTLHDGSGGGAGGGGGNIGNNGDGADDTLEFEAEYGMDSLDPAAADSLLTPKIEDAAGAHSHEGGKHRYKCKECGKGFITPSKLQRHSYSHSGIRPFSCNFCNKSFSQAANLKTHVRNTHPEMLDVSAVPVDYPVGGPATPEGIALPTLPVPPSLLAAAAAEDAAAQQSPSN